MAERLTLDEQIHKNKNTTIHLFIMLFLILFALVFGIGFVLGYPPLITAPFALAFGLLYLMLASGFSVSAILRSARARAPNLQVREERILVQVVEEMAIAAQLPM